jgi:hypothetical protein
VAVGDDRQGRLPTAEAACRTVASGCPRGDLAIYDTSPDLANRYLTVVHAGLTDSDVERSD